MTPALPQLAILCLIASAAILTRMLVRYLTARIRISRRLSWGG